MPAAALDGWHGQPQGWPWEVKAGKPYGPPCATALERCCGAVRARWTRILASHPLLPRQARNRYDYDVLGRLAALLGHGSLME